MLLVHGLGAHTHWWDESAPLLAATLSPAAVDLGGHGDSPWRPAGDYSPANFAADIEAARAALGWERFHLVGHSLGARAALDYAAAHPARLSRLAVVDFLPELRGGDRFPARPQPLYAEPAEVVSRFRLQPAGTTLSADALAKLAELSYKKTDAGYTWKFDWRALKHGYGDVWEKLPSIKTKTLVVYGTLSKLMDRAIAEKVAALMPDAGVAAVEGAHHHVPLDEPRALAEVLLSFLGVGTL